jgi:HSP20 family protein
MLTRWSDFDRTFSYLDQLRRRMDRLFDEYDGGVSEAAFDGGWPRSNLIDAGAQLVLTAELPGLSDRDVKIEATQDGLTFSGERRSEAPAGYSVHRQERPSFRFSRSVAFPCKVDTERTTASLVNGVLTVTIPKAPEAQPRHITVKAS